jgi:hypothetical protein
LWFFRQYAPALFSASRPTTAKLMRLSRCNGAVKGMARPSIQEADAMILKLGLHVFPGFWDIPQQTRDKMCNGMGPDWFGPWWRGEMNDFGRDVIWCLFVHDPAFFIPFNDGTRERWQKWTQDPWEINSKLCVAYAKLSASNWWRRFRIDAHAGIIVEALRVGAFEAYRSAFKRGESVETNRTEKKQ